MKTVIALVMVMVFVTGPVLADSYIGLGVGFAKAESATKSEATDTLSRLVAGYNLNSYLSIEADYKDFGGTIFSRSTISSDDVYAYHDIQKKISNRKAMSLSALIKYPLIKDNDHNSMDIIGGIGLARWKSKSTTSNSTTVISIYDTSVLSETTKIFSEKKTGISPFISVGVSLNLGKTISVRLEHYRYIIDRENVSGLSSSVLILLK